MRCYFAWKTLEDRAWLKDIPHPGKLITKGKVEGNIFQPLMPKNDEEEKCAYPEEEYNANVENMVALEKFVNENPFTNNISKEVEVILKELAKARRGAVLFENVPH